MSEGKTILNIGCGRKRSKGAVNIDCVQFVDGNGDEMVDLVMDIESEQLPYGDDTVDTVLVENVLEHVDDLRFLLNECHRVLKEGGTLDGCVPVAGTELDYRDPTHKRHFVESTFAYFTGTNPAKPLRPSHPKYADYGFMPWVDSGITRDGDMIYFKLTPRGV